VVLTFDDGFKAHRTLVAPLLRDLGFGATFFVTHAWMADGAHFMNWKEIAEVHGLGFEIGNHTWLHADLSVPRYAARLKGELTLVDYELKQVGVPRPVSAACGGDAFGPEATAVLRAEGYRFARRGVLPEAGAAYDPLRQHRLLIPTTGDVWPDWTLANLSAALDRARDGRIVVLRFHNIDGAGSPRVSTTPEQFRGYMEHLKTHGFQVVALRDLEAHVGTSEPDDPLLRERFPKPREGRLDLPLEMQATRASLRFWLQNMVGDHRYSPAEASEVCGLSQAEVVRRLQEWKIGPSRRAGRRLKVLPYPGGRHPRIGYLDGAISPTRGTKASVFLPWNDGSYVVVDVPEVIFSNLGVLYLAHVYYPTCWDRRNLVIEDRDWERTASGGLRTRWALPDGLSFGAIVEPMEDRVDMEVWLRNGSSQLLSGLETQICVLFKGAPGFNAQSNDNKIFRSKAGAVRSAEGQRYILSWWERPKRDVSGAPQSPCLNLHPVLPDCAPGATVRVRGHLWFYEGPDVERELARY